MFQTTQNRVALISVDGDPSAKIGQEEARGQNVYVHQVGMALAEQGWQVDMFTHRCCPRQTTIVPHHPNCRTSRLNTGPAEFIGRDHLFDYLLEFVAEFQKFQQQQGLYYPIVHTNYWLSAWVGMELKKRQPLSSVYLLLSRGS